MQHPVLVDAYIQFDGVKGSCSDDKHSGWTELVSWNHAVHQAAAESASSAIGHGMGKSEHEDYWVEAAIDASFAKLFELASSGAYVKNAKIELCQAAGDNKHVFLTTNFKELVISHVILGGASNGFPTMKI